MAFEVGVVNPQDLAEVISVIFRAHCGEDPYVNAVFPDNLTKEGQENALVRLSKSAEASEQARWEKVTEGATGKIVGIAIWLIHEHEKPVQVSDSGPSPKTEFKDEDAEFAASLYASAVGVETSFWMNNSVPLINLFVMSVAPEHQYQGVGALLMKSGLQLADNIKAKCTVMSTEAGRWLYQKSGFVVKRHATLQVPEKFASKPAVKLFHMVRERAE